MYVLSSVLDMHCVRGASAESGAGRILILMTDGKSTNDELAKSAAREARDQHKVKVMGVCVGCSSIPEDLKVMVTQPHDTYTFFIEDVHAAGNALSVLNIAQTIRRCCKLSELYIKFTSLYTYVHFYTNLEQLMAQYGIPLSI